MCFVLFEYISDFLVESETFRRIYEITMLLQVSQASCFTLSDLSLSFSLMLGQSQRISSMACNYLTLATSLLLRSYYHLMDGGIEDFPHLYLYWYSFSLTRFNLYANMIQSHTTLHYCSNIYAKIQTLCKISLLFTPDYTTALHRS